MATRSCSCGTTHFYTSINPEVTRRSTHSQEIEREMSDEMNCEVALPFRNPEVIPGRDNYWIKNLRLTQEDLKVLDDPKGMLNQSHMDAAAYLLRKYNWTKKKCLDIGGLDYQVILADDIRLNTFWVKDTAVQILHVPGHWQVVARYPGDRTEVHFFCSLGWPMDNETVRVMGHLLKLPEKTVIKVQHHVMQKQVGTVDCGLFAIFVAMCIVSGHEPSKLVTADQSSMRKHFKDCCTAGAIRPFPAAKRSPEWTTLHDREEVTIPALWHVIRPQESVSLPLSKRPTTNMF